MQALKHGLDSVEEAQLQFLRRIAPPIGADEIAGVDAQLGEGLGQRRPDEPPVVFAGVDDSRLFPHDSVERLSDGVHGIDECAVHVEKRRP